MAMPGYLQTSFPAHNSRLQWAGTVSMNGGMSVTGGTLVRRLTTMGAQWKQATRARRGTALSMAEQNATALDQWFEATTHTFNSKSTSARQQRGAAESSSWEARMASQEELKAINLSDPVPGPCETGLCGLALGSTLRRRIALR